MAFQVANPNKLSNQGSGSVNWTIIGNAARAQFSGAQVTKFLTVTNCLLTVPDKSTITGIQISLTHDASDHSDAVHVTDHAVYLTKDGISFFGTNHADTKAYWAKSGKQDVVTYFGSPSVWGIDLTVDEINSPDFGIGIQAASTAPLDAGISLISITVFYNALVTAQTGTFFPLLASSSSSSSSASQSSAGPTSSSSSSSSDTQSSSSGNSSSSSSSSSSSRMSSSSGPDRDGPGAQCPQGASCNSIQYFNGQVRLQRTDVSSRGFGMTWSRERTYSNQMASNFNVGNGWNWASTDFAYLATTITPGVALALFDNLNATRFFSQNPSTGAYSAMFGDLSTLVHNTGAQQLVLTDSDGTVTIFHDFASSNRPGGFVSRTSPGGNVLSVTSENTTQVLEVQQSQSSTIQSFLYTYTGTNLTNCTLRTQVGGGSWQNVVQAIYTYYDGIESYGSLDDLKTVERQMWQGSVWASVGTEYYRYYVAGESNGFVHGLKYVCLPQNFMDLVAAVGNPFTASNAQVSLYADYYFEYGSGDSVTKEVSQSGSLTSTYSYFKNFAGSSSSSASGSSPDYNAWYYKTVETQPDGSTNTIYANAYGQTMLFVLQPPASSSSSSSSMSSLGSGSSSLSSSSGSPAQWCNFYRYDNSGNVILSAEPSAVLGFSEIYPDLLNYNSSTGRYAYLNNTAGLIHLTGYYTSADAPQPAGYKKNEQVQQGQTGSAILLHSWAYTSVTAGGTTAYRVSQDTQYPDASSPSTTIQTSYSYTYYSGSVQVQQKTTTLPVISTSQNGSGTANTRKSYFDALGNETWTMDERGFITSRTYDLTTGAVIQRVDDYNTTGGSAPSGWNTPSGGGINLVTDITVDIQGRPTRTLGPSHTISLSGTATTLRTASWAYYDDPNFTTYSSRGYATGSSPSYSYTLVNPVTISIKGPSGRVNQDVQAASSTTSGSLATIIAAAGSGSAAFPQTSYTRWTTYEYTDCCLTASKRVYKLIPSSGTGSSGTNYDETDYGYGPMHRQYKTVTPGGTITETVFDSRGLVLSTWVGTNDAGGTFSDPSGGGLDPLNNMVMINSNIYDNGQYGGDGNLTRQTLYADGSTTRVWNMTYDFRDRLITKQGPINYFAITSYDNLDRVVKQERYNTTSSGNLIGRAVTQFDDLSRVYQSTKYAVDPNTGTVGNGLTSNTWYDATGNVIKSLPAGSKLFTKTNYDSLGRTSIVYIGYGPDSTYADAASVINNTILEQNEIVYDNASNAIQSNNRQRYHNAVASQTGALQDPSTSPNARVTYVSQYPDAVGRMVSTANYGTNGGSSLTRPATPPASSSTILVTTVSYNSAGDILQSIDPAGYVTRNTYDNAGRQASVTENYVASSSSSSSGSSSSSSGGTCAKSDDINRITQYTYSPDGPIATLVVQNSRTGNQTTTYTYGTTLTESGIATSNLLRYVAYPDSTGGSDQVAYTYNRQQQLLTLTDQRGTVHEYVYDLLGRLTNDRVTTVGTGVNNYVLRMATAYEVRGLVSGMTSYNNSVIGSGTVVNDVQLAYNSFGQLISDKQSHSGLVGSSTPQVQYGYESGSANTIRPTLLTYPNSRAITIDYGTSGGINDSASRVENLIDGGATTLVTYSYLGMNSAVEVTYPQPSTQYTLLGSSGGNNPTTGDIYWGLDLFGRIVDSRWYNTGTSADVDRIKYGYDQNSNRIWRQNPVATAAGKAFDEYYHCDGLQRLKDMQRGTLNGTQTAITSPTFGQCWTLDSTGNWAGFNEAASGSTWTTVQSRTANMANEITAITTTTGTAWTKPTYDAAGNMKTVPQPLTPGSSFNATYDAWNRLIRLNDVATGNIVEEYRYDVRNFRVQRMTYTAGVLSETRQLYYTSDWREIEDRLGGALAAERQYVWGVRYIDDLVIYDRSTVHLYCMQDANWNVTGIIDTSGAVKERYVYAAYGQTLYLNLNWNPLTNQTSAYLFDNFYCGYRYDAATGLYSVRFRMYHPQLGSWITRDPLNDINWSSLYEYNYSKPYGSTDPIGLSPKSPWDHHWFPNNGKQKKKLWDVCGELLNALENVPYTNVDTFVDLFTTTFGPEGWGTGTDHTWIHYQDGYGKWLDDVNQVYDNSQSCCELLTKMKNLIASTMQELYRRRHPEFVGPVGLPTLHKYRGTEPTSQLFLRILEEICSQGGPPPCQEPVPVLMPVPVMEAPGDRNREPAVPLTTGQIIVGGAAAAAAYAAYAASLAMKAGEASLGLAGGLLFGPMLILDPYDGT